MGHSKVNVEKPDLIDLGQSSVSEADPIHAPARGELGGSARYIHG